MSYIKTELRDDNLPATSLSPVKGRSVGSFRRVLQNRSFLLLWLAQLLSQPEILLGGHLGEGKPLVTLSRRKAGTLRQMRERNEVA